MTVEEPEDLIVLLKDYEHGDPATNGKGHRLITHQGQQAVLMPGAPVWRVRRKTEKGTEIRTQIDDGSENVCERQIEQKEETMKKDIFGTRAVGQSMTIGDLFGSRAASGASSSSRALTPGATQKPASHLVFLSGTSIVALNLVIDVICDW